MNKFRLKTWEIILILLAILLFCVSTALYVGGVHILGLHDQNGGKPIGKLIKANGTVRRELINQSDFREIGKEQILFVADTIVTSPESGATILLDDGSTIELGPSTMVKLEGEPILTLGGISRMTRVQVVNGQVTGQGGENSKLVIANGDQEKSVGKGAVVMTASNEKPVIPKSALDRSKDEKPAKRLVIPHASPKPSPSPSPSPRPSPSVSPSPSPSPLPRARIVLITPKNGMAISVDNGSPAPTKMVPLTWQLNGLPQFKPREKRPTAFVQIVQLAGPSLKTMVIFKQAIPYENGQRTIPWTANAPGEYEWSVQVVGTPQTTGNRFRVLPDFIAIRVSPPEAIAAHSSEGLEISKTKLKWRPYPSASVYDVKLLSSANPTDSFAETQTSSTEVQLTQTRPDKNQGFFTITSKLPSGFIVHSSTERFVFDFVPPEATIPADKTIVSYKKDNLDENGILLAWRKTGVSEGYIIEIATDSAFKKLVIKQTLKDNFFAFKIDQPTKQKPLQQKVYYWRVYCFANKILSKPTPTRRFAIGR